MARTNELPVEDNLRSVALSSRFFFVACSMVTVCECAQKEEMLMGVHNIIIIEIARAADGAFTRFALVDRV